MEFDEWFKQEYPHAVDGYDYGIADMRLAYAQGQQEQRKKDWRIEGGAVLMQLWAATDSDFILAELKQGVYGGDLQAYLRKYGERGANNLRQMLDGLKSQVDTHLATAIREQG